MKKMRLENKEEDVLSTTIQEISLLKELCHSNIVSLQGILGNNLDSIPPGQFVDSSVNTYSCQIRQRDVVLSLWKSSSQRLKISRSINNKGTTKLAALDLAKDFGISNRVYIISNNTPAWICRSIAGPLICGDSEIDQFFRILGALDTPNNEVVPFPKWKPGSLTSHVKNLVDNGLDLLSKMSAHWQVNPTKQVSCKITLNHPYFSDLDNQIEKM
ncbi:unnamed protein product [Nyctereutes procyonoides]|uniref:(raccoon dog) hypothetical protein n=1 Tax=Nyctereutes procyonoides TaxID=34880 RepID=A0A811ZJ23_NYCPR|nr:unnamed protein product [Nyctereutes procyonoides]